ncbi:heme o synthase [Thermomicrobiaceae bacterium CFH 74404]|uniref:Protoheme IX farnesyltransferase n=1 Tax=Thermalbibacter longus TaxID=2951981 RepID=A0AA42BDZ2_9BACT|nr:heme o synthase [Thermalbibacter longus]MCM8750243.1 heme o synthase [Thermalbibacter longus]
MDSGSLLRRFRRLAIATAIAGYLLIVFGGTVRVLGAGMGCGPDWPLCNGQVIPDLDLLAWIEFIHRLLALSVIVLTGLLAITGWRLRRLNPWYGWLPLLAAGLVLVQAGLGAVTVFTHLEALVVTIHLGVALTYLATALVLGLLAIVAPQRAPRTKVRARLSGWGVASALSVFVLMLTGAYTAKSGAGFACQEWPLCGDAFVPTGWTAIDVHLTHRLVALVATGLVVASAIQARRRWSDAPLIAGLAVAAAVLMGAQIFVGAANIWFQLAPAVSVAHLAVATLIWATLVLVIALDRLQPAQVIAGTGRQIGAPRPLVQAARDYLVLTKPGVMTLLLLTTICAMMVAAAGIPPLGTFIWTVIGGALAAGGASAINHWWDRDIDALMSRTRSRPLPQGRVLPEYAAIFGVTLSVLSVYVLTAFVNPLAALLSLSGNLFYVFVYTIWLKRTTPQNIVIGGAAGAVPPLVGWAAVTGQVSLPALLMFLLVFAWTPPHFWALALFKKTDYSVAGVPMLPAVAGEEETRRQIFIYTVLMVLASLAFYPLGTAGLFYLVAALLLGARFLWLAGRLLRERSDQLARRLFFYSMQYLGLLFLALVVDAALF